jgi:hypothetical protein
MKTPGRKDQTPKGQKAKRRKTRPKTKTNNDTTNAVVKIKTKKTQKYHKKRRAKKHKCARILPEEKDRPWLMTLYY